MRRAVGEKLISYYPRVVRGLSSQGKGHIQLKMQTYVDFLERETAIRSLLEAQALNPNSIPPTWESMYGATSSYENYVPNTDTPEDALAEIISHIKRAERHYNDESEDQPQEPEQIQSEPKVASRTIPVTRRGKQAHRKSTLVKRYWELVDEDPDQTLAECKKIVLLEIQDEFEEEVWIGVRTLERYIDVCPRP